MAHWSFVSLFSLRNVLPRALSSLEQSVAPNHDSRVTDSLLLFLCCSAVKQCTVGWEACQKVAWVEGTFVSFNCLPVLEANYRRRRYRPRELSVSRPEALPVCGCSKRCRRIFFPCCCSDRTLTSRVSSLLFLFQLLIATIQNGRWNERRRDGWRVRFICCLCLARSVSPSCAVLLC